MDWRSFEAGELVKNLSYNYLRGNLKLFEPMLKCGEKKKFSENLINNYLPMFLIKSAAMSRIFSRKLTNSREWDQMLQRVKQFE